MGRSLAGMVLVVVGLGMIVLGGMVVLAVLGFATMIDPALPPEAWWGEYRAKLLRASGEIGTGLVLGAAGIGLAMVGSRGLDDSGPRPPDRSGPTPP